MSAPKWKHRPCPCGCGELADECMEPTSGLNAFAATYGGLVIDPKRCAYCAAWPETPCALHFREDVR